MNDTLGKILYRTTFRDAKWKNGEKKYERFYSILISSSFTASKHVAYINRVADSVFLFLLFEKNGLLSKII